MDSVKSLIAVGILLVAGRICGHPKLILYCQEKGWQYYVLLRRNLTLSHQDEELSVGVAVAETSGHRIGEPLLQRRRNFKRRIARRGAGGAASSRRWTANPHRAGFWTAARDRALKSYFPIGKRGESLFS